MVLYLQRNNFFFPEIDKGWSPLLFRFDPYRLIFRNEQHNNRIALCIVLYGETNPGIVNHLDLFSAPRRQQECIHDANRSGKLSRTYNDDADFGNTGSKTNFHL